MFSKKDLWLLIWPLIIERFLAITVGIVDIIMVGTLGEAAVSGVSLVDQIFIMIEQIFAALATGGAVVCSQYIGKKDLTMAGKTAKQLIYSIVFLSIAIMIIGFIGRQRLLSLIFGVVENDVMENALTYFFYMLIGLPSVALYNGCAALFRAQGNSKVSMLTAVLVNIINVTGNAIMLFVMKRGVEGVAIPTFIARSFAAILLLYLLSKNPTSKKENIKNIINIQGITKVNIDFVLIKRILQVGIPAGIENSIFQIGKILVLSLIATFGTASIAANAAANTIASFGVMSASAIGVSMLTIVGQCIGAGRPDDAQHYTNKLLKVAYASLWIINIPILIFLKPIIRLYNLSLEASFIAWQMLMSHGLVCLIVWPLSFSLPNALRAANDGKFTMVTSIVSMWTVRIGLSYVLARLTNLGALSVWVAMMVDWVVRSIFFGIRFKSGKWKTKHLI
ncbi:MAG: MATE family efflux transporter [Treponema sp.]|nr:MATE family efflux transporter [Treponema sp.]